MFCERAIKVALLDIMREGRLCFYFAWSWRLVESYLSGEVKDATEECRWLEKWNLRGHESILLLTDSQSAAELSSNYVIVESPHDVNKNNLTAWFCHQFVNTLNWYLHVRFGFNNVNSWLCKDEIYFVRNRFASNICDQRMKENK